MRYPVHPGVLEVFCGPMKSGKTREAINRVDKLEYIEHHDYRFVKPSIDTRSEHVESRFGELSVTCTLIDEDEPGDLQGVVDGETIIVIDEAQFFDTDIINVVRRLVEDGRNVVVAGLDLDFRGEPFGAMPGLLSLADHVTKLTGICDYEGCSNPGTRTQRLIDGEPSPYHAPTILVEDDDADEAYEVRCKDHHVVPRTTS
jgi:thymidine kinase